MIPEIKKILYATDFSHKSSYAFLYAVDMALKRDASAKLNLAKHDIIFRMSYRLRATLEDVPLEEVNDEHS